MMNEVMIRKAMPTEFQACAEIVGDWIDDTDWIPKTMSRQQLEQAFIDASEAGRTIWVAEQSGKIAGYMSVDKEAMIHGIYLAREFRCRGIGKALINYAKSLFPSGVELEVHEPNIHGQRFYDREGFEKLDGGDRNHAEDDIPIIRLRWEGANHA